MNKREEQYPCVIPWCDKSTPFYGNILCHSHREIGKKYSLSEEQYAEMMVPYVCDGCLSEGVKLNVDHDHSCCPGYKSCGKCVRGALCTPCNSALGLLKDDAERLTNLLMYLAQNN